MAQALAQGLFVQPLVVLTGAAFVGGILRQPKIPALHGQ